jgi:leucyl aminopeptidase
MTRITLSHQPPTQAGADLLVLPVAAGDGVPVAPPPTRAVLDDADMDLAALASTGQLTGALDESLLVPAYDRLAAPALLLVGVGPDEGRTLETLRRAAAVAVAGAGHARTVATTLPWCPAEASPGSPARAAARLAAVAEGFGLAAYRFDRYKSRPEPPLEEVVLLSGEAAAGEDRGATAAAGDASAPTAAAGDDLEAALRRALAMVAATRYTRDLVNEPAANLRPAELAAEAARLAAERGLEVDTIEGEALARGGFGAVAAVGAGSGVPPRLVVLRHRPPGARVHVGLVGKGVTFDSGGLDLKRGKSIAGMKDDMAGAATVLGVLGAVASLAVPVAVTGVLPLVENMPGGAAMRPGDVIRAHNGTSIEITDTDAEGRLALADGLALAAESRPDAILDVATLTGSAVMGLGPACTAVLSNAPPLAAAVLEAAAVSGEPAVELPLLDDYRRFLDSEVADLRNASDEPGDAIQAALFLREFVAGLPWAHLDIAGPATATEARYHQPKGATGCMVRTLIELLERLGRAGAWP